MQYKRYSALRPEHKVQCLLLPAGLEGTLVSISPILSAVMHPEFQKSSVGPWFWKNKAHVTKNVGSMISVSYHFESRIDGALNMGAFDHK